jgi:phosphate transport system substrate-binding protein
MQRRRVWLVWLVSLIAVAGCSSAVVATPRPTVLTIAGATALQPALQELTAEFTRRHPTVLFTLRGGGSTLGEQQALERRVNLGASSLFPPPADAPTARLVRTPVGVDGLAIVVHPSNPVAVLSLDQLQQLYSGEILDWPAVGGSEAEVVLVSREDGSGARKIFEDRVMDDKTVSLTAVVMPTSRDVVDYVRKTPSAIGYVSRGLVMAARGGAATATPEPDVRVVPIDGKLPALDALRDQSYPLIQPLYLVSMGEPRGWTRQFIDFVLSPAGQAIVRRYHLPVR